MLPLLENLPRTQDDWNRWSWSHRDSHDRIRAAIKSKHGVDLSDYQTDPIDPGAIEAMTKRLQGHLAANPSIAGELEKKFEG